jgi:L-serine dehydratase
MSQSIFNHVLGPVLHGPSSSHTAAAYHIAALVRSFLGEEPVEAHVAFDENGSWGQVYAQQGSDLAFTCGVLGWPIDDGRFFEALETARRQGVTVAFAVNSDVAPVPWEAERCFSPRWTDTPCTLKEMPTM